MKRLGLIVNPIAGMGGALGLKGTDGGMLQKAVRLGAKPGAAGRAQEAIAIVGQSIPELSLVTCTGSMGEDIAKRCNLPAITLDDIPRDESRSTPLDTQRAVAAIQRVGVDLLLFAGGDGTARDICNAFLATGDPSDPIPVLGLPAGVKMHSGVFAITPRRAGEIASRFLLSYSREVLDAEVMDIDEDAFRGGRLSARLHGYLKTPAEESYVQTTKSGGIHREAQALEDIARQVVSEMEDDTLYVLGPGSTTAAISSEIEIPNTLLGVDAVLDGELLAADASEQELLKLTVDRPSKIVVSVIGGQGYIFGRGNQQISPQVIRRVGKENIVVVATRSKLIELGGRPLLVDTGDAVLDEELIGYTRVVTGIRESHTYRVSC